MSVIIVDDNKDITETLEPLLKLGGIEVLGTAHDGKSGAELYSKTLPDVVLLDVMMPNYDGYYGFDIIKKENPNAKVIFLTANPEQTKLLEISDPYVTVFEKPFSIDVLIEEIKSM